MQNLIFDFFQSAFMDFKTINFSQCVDLVPNLMHFENNRLSNLILVLDCRMYINCAHASDYNHSDL